MNVLVDTNVLISAVIRDRLPLRVIDEIVFRDDWLWIVSAEIETEFFEVLAGPKFKVTDVIQQSWTAFIQQVTIRIEPSTDPTFLRDPKDEPFIAAALASDADYLITGDKDLLDEQLLVSTRILRPADFARLFAIV
jgi:putative PIN family toxin of toxin-antitoxin system